MAALTAPPSARRGSRWLVAGVVSLVFAALLVRHLDLAEVGDRLEHFPPSAFLLGCLWLALAGWLRATRLRLLLRGEIGPARSYALVQAYNLITSTVPAGVGEVAAAWLFRRSGDAGFRDALQALLVGRVLDLGVLLLLLLGALAGGVRLPGIAVGSLAAPATLLLGLLIAPVVVHLRAPERLPRLLDDTRRALGDASRWRRAAGHALAVAAEGTRSLPDGRATARLALLTLATQLLAAAALYAFLPGAGVVLGFVASVVALVLFLLLRLLPVQGLAGIGTNTAWWALALSWLDLPGDDAIAAGTVLYVVFYVAIAALALSALPLLWLGQARHV